MDGGHLEGQCGGMFVFFVFFSQGIRSAARSTGRVAFMLSLAVERGVSHLSY